MAGQKLAVNDTSAQAINNLFDKMGFSFIKATHTCVHKRYSRIIRSHAYSIKRWFELHLRHIDHTITQSANPPPPLPLAPPPLPPTSSPRYSPHSPHISCMFCNCVSLLLRVYTSGQGKCREEPDRRRSARRVGEGVEGTPRCEEEIRAALQEDHTSNELPTD